MQQYMARLQFRLLQAPLSLRYPAFLGGVLPLHIRQPMGGSASFSQAL